MRTAWGTVVAVEAERAGLQRLRVEVDGSAAAAALNYPALAGTCRTGDRVLLNTTAVDLGLGTGGSHLVIARLGGAPGAVGVSLDDPSGGHVMKLRYTPLQRDVLSVESQESPFHDLLAAADDVHGMPVVCCGLHSQLPLVAAAIKALRPQARVAWCMTDEAALPLALSELVPACTAAGLVDLTVTCGQAFGGDLESVTLHSGLIAARLVGEADIAIVGIGPGVVGTGTVLGHGGVAQGEALNAAAAVGGRPVAALRVSFADARERHRGVSHHTLIALSRIALAAVTVAVPRLPAAELAAVEWALADAGVWERHVRADAGEGHAIPDTRGVPCRSMGRTPDDDPAFFAAAAAAGTVAAEMVAGIST
jgi:hypothetical protein